MSDDSGGVPDGVLDPIAEAYVLVALIRRAGGSVTLAREELDAVIDAGVSADGRRVEYLFTYEPNDSGTEATIRAIAAPIRARPEETDN